MTKLAGRPFALIGVNVSRVDRKQLAKVMADERLPWRTFADQGAIARQWCMPGTPTMYLIDDRGVIRRKWVGAPGSDALDEALEAAIHAAEGR